jgi:hypothetical protein
MTTYGRLSSFANDRRMTCVKTPGVMLTFAEDCRSSLALTGQLVKVPVLMPFMGE